MQRDSVLIFGGSLIISVLLVGSLYCFSVVRTSMGPEPQSLASPIPDQPQGSYPNIPTTTPNWTDRPIKCFDDKVGEFWTNATDCQSADLQNRLSIAQPPQKIDYLSPGPDEMREKIRSGSKTSSGRKPSLRRTSKAVPSDLSVSCKFAVGRALEIERPLSAADDPAESTWRENYCKWVKEARSGECRVSSDYFYYGHLCLYGS